MQLQVQKWHFLSYQLNQIDIHNQWLQWKKKYKEQLLIDFIEQESEKNIQRLKNEYIDISQ